MTHLRKTMLEELQRLNYSEDTTRFYVRVVEDFSRRFNRPPDRLGPRHIREYQAELFQKRKLSPGTVAHYLSALRFFYSKTLKKGWSVAETPYPKRAFHLPSILSQEEVTRLIDAALTPYHRILLMTLYATGARSAELTHLKVSDIDSKRGNELSGCEMHRQARLRLLGSRWKYSRARSERYASCSRRRRNTLPARRATSRLDGRRGSRR